MRWREFLIVVLMGLRLTALVFLLGRLPPVMDGHYVANDALRFHEIAVASGTPYRDFEVEVPPVEYFFLKATHGADSRETAVSLAWAQFLLDIVLVCALMLGWGQRAAIAYLVLSAPLIPFLYFRLDLLPVVLAVLGVALARTRAPTAGGIVLAAAVLAKVWPVALFPVLLVERRWKALAWATAATAAGMAAWVAWVGFDGLREVATFRSSHGWQIESVIGTVALLATARPVLFEGGALRVGEATTAARGTLLAVFAALAIGASLLAWRRGRDRDVWPDTGATLAVVIVAAMLLLSPILSWQYVAWLIPWAAIAATDRDYPLGLLTLACAGLTCWLIFLSLPLSERVGLAEAVALARDGVLLATMALAFVRLARRASREPLAPRLPSRPGDESEEDLPRTPA